MLLCKDRDAPQRSRGLGGSGAPLPLFLSLHFPRTGTMVPNVIANFSLGKDLCSQSKPDSTKAVLGTFPTIVSALVLESREWTFCSEGWGPHLKPVCGYETSIWGAKNGRGKNTKQKGLKMAGNANLMRLVCGHSSSFFSYSHSITWEHPKCTKYFCKPIKPDLLWTLLHPDLFWESFASAY